MIRLSLSWENISEELKIVLLFYYYVLQENFDPAEVDEVRPATELPPKERALVQSYLEPGYFLLGRVPYEDFPYPDFPASGLRTETLTLIRLNFDLKKRRYVAIYNFNSMKIPGIGSTSNMDPKVFTLSDENHGSAVHTMFQNFREVSTRSFYFSQGLDLTSLLLLVLNFFVKLTLSENVESKVIFPENLTLNWQNSRKNAENSSN